MESSSTKARKGALNVVSMPGPTGLQEVIGRIALKDSQCDSRRFALGPIPS